MNTFKKYIQQAAGQLWLVIVLLIVLPPIGIALLWVGKHFDQKKRWIITAVAALWWLLWIIENNQVSELGDSGDYGSCSATFYENGCTYYRDDNCNVVAKSCD